MRPTASPEKRTSAGLCVVLLALLIGVHPERAGAQDTGALAAVPSAAVPAGPVVRAVDSPSAASMPLTPRQKFRLALKDSVDPFNFVGAGISAGIEQGANSYSDYGQGASGYAKRYGAAYADSVLGMMIGGALLPSVFHQDPRYFEKGSGGVASRASYAALSVFRGRSDDGRWQPNYSVVLGALSAGAISNTYYPANERGVPTTMDNTLIDLGNDVIDAVVKEFVVHRFSRHAPASVQAAP
jgi:hypothetical protein